MTDKRPIKLQVIPRDSNEARWAEQEEERQAESRRAYEASFAVESFTRPGTILLLARPLFAEFAVSEITHGQVIKNVRLAWRQISHLRGWRERGQFAVFEHGVDRAVCLLDQR